MPSSIEAELRKARTTITGLIEVLNTIKGRARNIVEDREDVTKAAARIVLDVDQAIAQIKKT